MWKGTYKSRNFLLIFAPIEITKVSEISFAGVKLVQLAKITVFEKRNDFLEQFKPNNIEFVLQK